MCGICSLPLCARRSVVLSLSARGSRALINSLRCCWCRGFFRLAPTPFEACQTQTRLTTQMKRIVTSGDAVQYCAQMEPQMFIDGLLTMVHRAHTCSHGLSLIRQTGMPERQCGGYDVDRTEGSKSLDQSRQETHFCLNALFPEQLVTLALFRRCADCGPRRCAIVRQSVGSVKWLPSCVFPQTHLARRTAPSP